VSQRFGARHFCLRGIAVGDVEGLMALSQAVAAPTMSNRHDRTLRFEDSMLRTATETSAER